MIEPGDRGKVGGGTPLLVVKQCILMFWGQVLQAVKQHGRSPKEE